ncbi:MULTISPECIES: flagellar protein FlgN [Paenarthrobacter]|uniref:flagellar protein FlgN n=1 Tax=Paenarthrobacter TaxID=1742992 RepID=UPI000AC6A7A2|nr:flagellar protein FlgN [Paenarthrobacter ureafaciens]RWW95743.1 flagellar protein FlgN [Paenarthrobacter ureafaciens]UOD82146.1 flagellar protein FlgN [Paenarthrobacter ureafaciens]WNZ05643.1 flagellar protein FlgN [Paenarthrobacter ureafaciens]
MGADELSATLWRERRQLDFLLFLLETQLLHLRAGNWHRLEYTASELEKVVESLRFESLARGVEAAALAAEWKAPDQTSLPSLAGMAPAGIWPDLLKEHHRALVILLESIDAVAADNLSALEQEPEPADAEPDDLAIMTLDVNVQRARAAVTSAALPSLRDFLGTT